MSSSQLLRFLLLLICSTVLLAQNSATLSGTVVDPTETAVPDAELTLSQIHRSVVRQTVTNGSGIFVFDSLAPGEYTLEVVKSGFAKLTLARVRLSGGGRQTLILRPEFISAESVSVTVAEGVEGLSTDPSTGGALSFEFAENLPLNGRTAQSIILISPGAVSPSLDGRVNADGLFSDVNYYALDGVSANAGFSAEGPRTSAGDFKRGRLGSGQGLASTSEANLFPIEVLQGVRVQNSTFAAEFGRTAGTQISLTSRAGTDAFHGSLFEYARNDRFNANDWLANTTGQSRGKMRHNNFGATLGGPIVSGRTYFFIAYEGVRSQVPDTSVSIVPDLEIRESASSKFRPYLMAFPVPNGLALGDNAAQFTTVTSSPSRRDFGSLRIDHMFTENLRLFARYSLSPSEGELRGGFLTSPNVLTHTRTRPHTFTTSLDYSPTPQTTNDLRVNVFRSSLASSSAMDAFGGAVPLTGDLLFPEGVNSSNGEFRLNVAGATGYSFAEDSREWQNQVHVVDNLTSLQGGHTIQIGADIRRRAPTYFRKPYGAEVIFNGLAKATGALFSGDVKTALVRSRVEAVYPTFLNLSAYAQDTWKATDRTTLTYGLRWDIAPPPDVRDGQSPFSLDSSFNVNRLRPLYTTNWRDLSPRVGLAYEVDTTPGSEVMFRAGLGIFYDLGYGSVVHAFGGAPYINTRILPSASFPLSAADRKPSKLPSLQPYGLVYSAKPDLLSPRIWRYGLSAERMFGRAQSLTLGYVGTKGGRLLTFENRAVYSNNFDLLHLTSNRATSSYNALQVQFRRTLHEDLQTWVSYTLGHSVDSAPSDMVVDGFSTIPVDDRADSDFDIRHNLSFAGSYRLLAPKAGLLNTLLGDWWMDWVLTAHTAQPIDVRGISTAPTVSDLPDTTVTPGLFGIIRPDYTGESVWLADQGVPGGKRLNPAAFELPGSYKQGNLLRNAIRGFGKWQLDFAFRRQIAVGERLRIQVGAQAFNVFNHANFADPSPYGEANVASPNFGVATRMLGQSMGGGFRSLDSVGGPRSLQLALRLRF